MKVTVEDLQGIKLLRLAGELRGEEKENLVDTFTDFLAGPRARIVLDLGQVSYMNSAGLGELVRLVAQANLQEARVILAGASPYLSGVIETTRLNRFFELSPNVEDALRQLT